MIETSPLLWGILYEFDENMMLFYSSFSGIMNIIKRSQNDHFEVIGLLKYHIFPSPIPFLP